MSSSTSAALRTRGSTARSTALLLCALSLALLVASGLASPASAADTGVVSGRVLGDGDALSGIKVEAISEDGAFATESTTTDSDGDYSIALNPGTYLLHFVGNTTWAPEYYNNRLYLESAHPVSVVRNQTTPLGDATLVKGGSISGTVTTLAPDKPSGLKVVATNHGTGQPFAATTDSTGKYSVKGLPEGPYELSFAREDTKNALYSAPEWNNDVHEAPNASPNLVWVGVSEDRTGFDAALEKGASLKGRITRADNTPVAGCAVDVSLDDSYFTRRTVHTKSDGSFSIIGLSPGKLTLTIGAISDSEPDCGLGTRYYDGDDVLGTTPSPTGADYKLGVLTTLGLTTDAGTLVYADGPVTETATVAPKVAGSPYVGSVLTASEGTWSAKPTSFTYAWHDNGTVIPGATARTFTPSKSLLGHKISVRVTASKSGATDGAVTSAQVTIGPTLIKITRAPSVSGTAKVGKTVKYRAGTTSPSVTTRAYQWLRDGKAISGATRSSRKLTSSDKRHKISLKVTYRRTGYTSISTKTAATGKVT